MPHSSPRTSPAQMTCLAESYCCSEIRIPKPLDAPRNGRASFLQETAGQILAVQMQYVEGIEDDGVLRMDRSMLERLKRRMPDRIYRHDLTVEHDGLSLESNRRGFHCRVVQRLVVARSNL